VRDQFTAGTFEVSAISFITTGWQAMPYGRIIKWFDDRGFGFIGDDQQPKSRGYFVHISAIGHAPNIGDAFEYDIAPALDGRERAANARPLSPAREECDRVFGDDDY
jgi:cold shock CspA family protein